MSDETSAREAALLKLADTIERNERMFRERAMRDFVCGKESEADARRRASFVLYDIARDLRAALAIPAPEFSFAPPMPDVVYAAPVLGWIGTWAQAIRAAASSNDQQALLLLADEMGRVHWKLSER